LEKQPRLREKFEQLIVEQVKKWEVTGLNMSLAGQVNWGKRS